jgi:CBS domain-containing protein
MVQTATLKVRDAMRRNVTTLAPGDEIEGALARFEEARISGAPVVDASGKLVGVLTLTDVARPDRLRESRVSVQRGAFEMSEIAGDELTDELDPEEVFYSKEDYSADLLGGERVSEWMTGEVVSVSPDASLEAACKAMVSHQIHRVFVTEGERLVGVLTSFDVVRALAGGRAATRTAHQGPKAHEPKPAPKTRKTSQRPQKAHKANP